MIGSSPFVGLAHYRRSVSEMYARVRRSNAPPEQAWLEFRAERDLLFKTHPLSALDEDQKAVFANLNYYPYDPTLRFILPVDFGVEPEALEVDLEEDGPTRLQRFGRVSFSVSGREVSLSLFWIAGYGGGIFLPFGDQTNREKTYGGGRYLLDTIKGADLGGGANSLLLDFNFAYNPSCAYNPRWHCPLAPLENRLPVPIRAGELNFEGAST